jgi:hypothetical protein
VPIRRALGAASAVAALGTVLVIAGAGPAGALDCVQHPDGTPESIASGTEELAGEGQLGTFWERYDDAVIGTVTGIRTDEREGSPTYGATEVDVRVAGVLGRDTAPANTTVRALDPGWMAGYPFELGVSYFIPVVAHAQGGIANFSHACDPVTVLDDPVAWTAALGELADGAGIAFAVAGQGGEPPGEGTSGSSWFVPVTSAAAVAAAGAAVVALRRRPLRGPSDPVLLAVGDVDQGVEGGGGPA